jgi:uncharacterized protein DUF4129
LLAGAVLALLALVAAASRADRSAGPGDPESRTVPTAFWEYLLTVGLLAAIAVLALVFYLRVPMRRRADRGRFAITQFLALAIIASLVVFAGRSEDWPDIPFSSGAEEARERPETPAQQAEDSGRESRPLRIRWEVFFAAGGLLIVGGIYAARRRSNSRRALGEPDAAAAALSAALDESVDDLRAERDPRRAVIAAYARMERILDRHGFPRFRAEAPLEYLSRVLRELRVRSEAVLALTELFERAKFSLHEIDLDMKEEAIEALIAVRDDLRETR